MHECGEQDWQALYEGSEASNSGGLAALGLNPSLHGKNNPLSVLIKSM